MSLLKNIYYHSCSLLPMPLIQTIGPSTTLLPYHHTVSSEFLPHINHLYNYKNEFQFNKDLDFLLKYYKPVDVKQVIDAVKHNKKLPAKSFLLSFDDGFREVHDIIAPILEKKGVPAVFFINPAFIDNKELFYRCKISLLIDDLQKNKNERNKLNLFGDLLHIEDKTIKNIINSLKKINQTNADILDVLAEEIDLSFDQFLQKQKPFLSSQQLQSLNDRGFSIGAHSMNHPYYPLLTLSEQIDQTIDSCSFLNEKLGTKECCFSFPHSDKELSQILFTQLNKFDIPLFFGIQNQKEEINNNILHRFNAERPEINMDIQLKGLIFMIWLRKLIGKNNVMRH